uniref:Uncharacterized protein n=1 Tax=Arundo donax TaxID=35708 RepID=A0A0A8ZNK5_ARUDO
MHADRALEVEEEVEQRPEQNTHGMQWVSHASSHLFIDHAPKLQPCTQSL